MNLIENVHQYQKYCVYLHREKLYSKGTTMNTATIGNNAESPIMRYWGMVKNLDNSVKLELISMLVDSMKFSEPAPAKKLNAFDYAGIWNDEEYMDADELAKAIRDSRHVGSSRDAIWQSI